MASSSANKSEPEEYVKNYQLTIMDTKLDAVLTSFKSMEKRMDEMINVVQTRPTTEQVKAMVDQVRIDYQKDLTTARKEIDLTYGGGLTTSRRLLWSLLTTGVGLIVTMGILIIGSFNAK